MINNENPITPIEGPQPQFITPVQITTPIEIPTVQEIKEDKPNQSMFWPSLIMFIKGLGFLILFLILSIILAFGLLNIKNIYFPDINLPSLGLVQK